MTAPHPAPRPSFRARAPRLLAALIAALALAPAAGVADPPEIDPASARPLILFRAELPGIGRELFATDLTERRTRLVRDINEGFDGSHVRHSDPRGFANLGDGQALFSAARHTEGRELWITDGTRRGTRLVRDINPGPEGSEPEWITPIGDGLAVFSAYTAAAGRELWITDGTRAGTRMLADLMPGAEGSRPWRFAALSDGRVAFYATSDGYAHAFRARDLWITDGTRAGTRAVHAGGDGPSVPAPFEDIYHHERPAELRPGAVLYTALVMGRGVELYISDFTPEGTRMVRDIYPGSHWSNPMWLTPLGDGRALFAATTEAQGRELWITDGTRAGTRMVRDIDPGAGSAQPEYLTPLGDGRVVFAAHTETHGREPWITDGTRAGTRLLRDIMPGDGNGLGWRSVPRGLDPWFAQVAPGLVLFAADNGSTGTELWRTNGTRSGTRLAADINTDPPHAGSDPHWITPLGDGRAVFGAWVIWRGVEPFVTNGRPARTRRIADLCEERCSSNPQHFHVLRPPQR